jgi:hypothetical protein
MPRDPCAWATVAPARSIAAIISVCVGVGVPAGFDLQAPILNGMVAEIAILSTWWNDSPPTGRKMS